MARSPPICAAPAASTSIDIPSRFHSNWMDNSKAKYLLEWEPDYDLEKLVDSAWQYERSQERSSCRLVSGLICVAGTPCPWVKTSV